jgi:EAL domain-containing protein (putative c-di-GMP-specific phosphodiesterase class I)
MIKIAKTFVDQLDNAYSDTAFLDAILRLAAALDLTVVAEGIERAEQADVLRSFNCGLGQGYYFARPMNHSSTGQHLIARGLRDREPDGHIRVA